MSNSDIAGLPSITGNINDGGDNLQTLDQYRLAIKDVLSDIEGRTDMDSDVAELLQMAPDAAVADGDNGGIDELKEVLEACLDVVDKVAQKYV